MERDRNKMADRIINLTLQILFRLTGEEYKVVKKSSSGRFRAHLRKGRGRNLRLNPGPPPHSLIHEEMDEQKILEFINKMIELLTGEVPIRCQDVAVYFSMEEWEYVEGHKDQYKDVMMEDQQPLTSPVRSSKRSAPERCPRPLLPQDDQGEDLNNFNAPETDVRGDEQYKEDIHTGKPLNYISAPETDVSGDEQYKEDILTGKLLNYISAPETDVSGEEQYMEDIPTGKPQNYINATDIKEEETDVSRDEQYKEDIPTGKDLIYISATDIEEVVTDVSGNEQNKEDNPTGNHPDECTRRSEEHLISSDSKADDHMAQDTYEEHSIIPDMSSALQSQDLSSDPFIPVASSDSSQTVKKQNRSKRMSNKHQKTRTKKRSYSCPECGKCFTCKSELNRHQRTHTGEKPFSCRDCGMCVTEKSDLVRHQITHTGEKPFPCSECGKCFTRKAYLLEHHKTHTGEKPFSCTECGKSFTRKCYLIEHHKTHTGEKPFSCSECGKCFTRKSHVFQHKRIHTGEKPFSCLECGKSFSEKSNFFRHQKIHTGEKLFP